MKPLALILLCVIMGTHFGYGQPGKYYTNKDIYVYRLCNPESAIEGEVPKGKRVKVVSSSPPLASCIGRTGWWEIRYHYGKGQYDYIQGYTHKSNLSYKSVTKIHTPASESQINTAQSVAFDPFVERTTTLGNLTDEAFSPMVNQLGEAYDCEYGQCIAIATSTGRRCRHCVSERGDIYCWQHK